MDDGRMISVVLNDSGEIEKIYIQYRTEKKQWDVLYTPDKAWVNSDLNNLIYDNDDQPKYNFNEIKKVAEAIFARFLKK